MGEGPKQIVLSSLCSFKLQDFYPGNECTGAFHSMEIFAYLIKMKLRGLLSDHMVLPTIGSHSTLNQSNLIIWQNSYFHNYT